MSDSRGASVTVSLTLTVSAGSGADEVKVGFNTAPRVDGAVGLGAELRLDGERGHARHGEHGAQQQPEPLDGPRK